MSAASLLCEIIVQGGKVASNFFSGDPNFAALVRHGYVHEVGMLSSVVCVDCDEAHSAPVFYEGGEYGYYCSELGSVPLSPAHLTAVLPDIPLLVGRLADAFGCRQRKQSCVHGQTWRIGAASMPSETVMLYYHPTLRSEDDARDLQNALGRETRSDWRLVVTSQGAMPMAGLAVVHLADLVEIDVETGDLGTMADPGMLAGVPRKNPGGRPSTHGELLKPMIEIRILNGEALETVNAEARAVRTAFQATFPDRSMPSGSAIKRYIREARGGS